MKQPTPLSIKPRFTNRSTESVTFQGKLSLPIHRWYRLTPSFSPQLATDVADHFKLDAGDFVLDPFSGVGTVPLSMKYRGVPGCSVEINPYLYFVSKVKTRTYTDIDAIESCFLRFLTKYDKALGNLPADKEAHRYLRENEGHVPRIHNAERWWSPPNLMQLVCLRRLLLEHTCDRLHSDLLKMGVLAILVPLSNAKHNHVSLTFADTAQPRIDVKRVLEAKLREMIDDLRAVSGRPVGEVQVFCGNSKQLSGLLRRERKFSAVITSPPYPNRFSYARETRPHLFFFDFIADAKAVGQLETDAIGGTWGKATSVLATGVTPKNRLLEDLLSPHLERIPRNGGLMASYVAKYFNDMYEHASQLAKVCRRRCRLAYVIGNSKFYGNPLPSDEILAEVFAHFGFRLDGIERMRKRQSKSGLHEAVIFMRRNDRRQSLSRP